MDFKITKLKKIENIKIGYSSHDKEYEVIFLAAAYGAKYIERHITLDKNMEGNDHKVSLLPHELNQMVQALHDTHISMGSRQQFHQ